MKSPNLSVFFLYLSDYKRHSATGKFIPNFKINSTAVQINARTFLVKGRSVMFHMKARATWTLYSHSAPPHPDV